MREFTQNNLKRTQRNASNIVTWKQNWEAPKCQHLRLLKRTSDRKGGNEFILRHFPNLTTQLSVCLRIALMAYIQWPSQMKRRLSNATR